MTAAVGVPLALASAAALNAGWIAQHDAARALPRLSLRQPLRSLRSVFADRAWLVGFVVGIAGWVLYVGALALAPLSVVQTASAGGIGILAALATRRGAVVTRAQRTAVGVSAAGLVLLGVSLVGGSEAASPPAPLALAGWLVAAAAVAALTIRPPVRLTAGAALGVAAGTLYAAGDVATKAATFAGGWLLLVPLVLAAHGAAFVALQLGFQRGGALATAGTASLLTNALPIAAGLVLFHEPLPGGALAACRVVAFACVVAGAATLARADSDTPQRRAEPDAAGPERVPALAPR